jgi:YesN/AraC family two-component response regulator
LESEQAFLSAVKNGELDYILNLKRKYGHHKLTEKGIYSSNPVRNEIYHLIVNTALITNSCMEGGMPPETAITLSELYIQKVDLLTSESEINQLNDDMVLDFTERMRKIKKNIIASSVICHCIQYIYNHMHEKITLDTLTKENQLHPNYLCSLFKKETGSTVGDFIRNVRLETAANMLLHKKFSYSDIAYTLCFSSPSHFSKLFKDKYYLTPREYQKKYS